MKKIMVFVFLTSLLFLPKQSLALSCAESFPPDPDRAYDGYDAVLIGSVKEVLSNGAVKKLTIKVEKSFKGVNKKIITVNEDITWGESQENAQYLFFLNKEGEKWLHPLCSPTTHNTGLADEFYADKEEIILQEVESTKSESKNTTLIIMIAMLALMVVVAGIITMTSKQRKNPDGMRRKS